MSSALPYGPFTDGVRRFLVQLAQLDADARRAVVTRYAAVAESAAFAAADRAVGDAIERGALGDARDALTGPLLQLVQSNNAGAVDGVSMRSSPDDDDLLDPIAEPALAAALSIITHDLLAASHGETLYRAFEPVIPRVSILLSSPATPPR